MMPSRFPSAAHLTPWVVALLFSFACGEGGCCASGGNGTPPPRADGGGLTGDSGFTVLPDGRVVDENGDPVGTDCGGLGQRCCGAGGAGACDDRGHDCDPRHDICCVGAGERCRSSGDCCSDLGCDRSTGLCVSPEGGPCTAPEECVEGTVCEGRRCEEPDDPGSGGPGEPCVRGQCASRTLVCDDETDTCERCGDNGEPCCEGRRPCGDSDDLVCSREECVEPDGCGRPGERCCAPDDACVFNARCDRDTMECDGRDDPDDDENCGRNGQQCCRNDSCDSGNICEPFITNSCIGIEDIIDFIGDIDCGEDGEICCLPWFTCEGNLRCSFLFCGGGDCTPVSGDCTTAEDCCHRFDTLCKQDASGTRRCCRPQNARCDNSTDCCGHMTCDTRSRTCACRAPGESCGDASDCCPATDQQTGGMVQMKCDRGQCAPACLTFGSQCSTESGSTPCCSGTSCGSTPGQSGTRCCGNDGALCNENGDCCGRMTCEPEEAENGETEMRCQCLPDGQECTTDGECCNGSECIFGQCTSTSGCSAPGSSCGTVDDCCGGNRKRCDESDTQGNLQCCTRDSSAPCETDTDCCGATTCETTEGGGKRCRRRGDGESCVSPADCDGSLLCDPESGTCAATLGT